MLLTRRMLCTPVSSSKHKDLCEKCDHLLDFGENCGLYRFCWLYLYVLTVFPLHFTRRMLCTPIFPSNQAQLYEKCDHLLDFEEKLSVMSLLLEMFRRLIAISIAFYTPNDMHAVFSADSSPTVRKMRPYTRFWRKLCVISSLLQIFRRLIAISIAFYTPNDMHAVFSADSNPTVCKMRPFTRFWRKLCVISVLLEIFRRLNAIDFAFYTPNTMHAVFSLETCPTVRKIRPFTRFWRKLSVMSLLLEILRSLNAISIAFYTPNAMHAVFSMETCPTVRKIRPFTRFWWQTVRYIGPAGDISTYKRYLHSILHAKCYARRL